MRFDDNSKIMTLLHFDIRKPVRRTGFRSHFLQNSKVFKISNKNYPNSFQLMRFDDSDFIWDFGKLPFPTHLGKYYIKIGKKRAKIHEIGKIKAIF